MQQLQCVALNYSPPPLSLTPVLLSLLILYCIFFPCPPNFLSILLFSLFVSVLFMHYLHFCFTFSAHSVFCCRLFFFSTLLFLLSLFFYFSTPSPTPPLHSFSPSLLSSLYLSPVLSALRRVSAITPLHLLIPVLIQPSTHSCLTSLYTALANIRTHTHVHAPCRLHTCPRGRKEPSVSTHSHPLTVQKNALCKRTGSINLPAASAYTLMLFRVLLSPGFHLIALYRSYYCTLVIG